jgi:hypothetical protein
MLVKIPQILQVYRSLDLAEVWKEVASRRRVRMRGPV